MDKPIMQRSGGYGPNSGSDFREAEAGVTVEWNVGDLILGLYDVKHVNEGGGMGLVYRVHHLGWGIDLAVKSPRAEYFKTEGQKENFIRECETWIGLGLHPHVVSCYYVRTLGRVPRVFAEYVEGGSLKDWIDSRKLYEGGHQEAGKRILDIAIQMAWGLGVAHDKGLIHQDIKPANVLVMPNGTAKITDFGLARARLATGEASTIAEERSILVSTGGMTPAYCSPEQAANRPLSRKADVWSWGLTVLEMYAGEVFWLSGQAAPNALLFFAEHGAMDKAIPAMPRKVMEILSRCFLPRPEERPQNMQELVSCIQIAYRESFSMDYPRPEPKCIELCADALNNHGVSWIDLGRNEEAERLFKEACKCHPGHLEARYNLGHLRWMSGQITDLEYVDQLETMRVSNEIEWRADYYLGLVHIERGDMEAARAALSEAQRKNPQAKNIQVALDRVQACASKTVRCVSIFGKEHTCFDVSVDGRWALSGSKDGTLQLWDMAKGECVRVFKGHTDGIISVTLSADGCWALSESYHLHDSTVRVWEMATGRCSQVIEYARKYKVDVSNIKLSADGRWALSFKSMSSIFLYWDLARGRLERKIKVRMNVWRFCLSADGRWALLGGKEYTHEGALQLWDVAKGRLAMNFEGNAKDVYAVHLSVDGRWALSGGLDNTVRLWDVRTGRCIRMFEGHTSTIEAVFLSADGRWVLSGGGDGTARLWDVTTGRCLRCFAEEGYCSINSVRMSSDNRWVVLDGSKRFRIWDVGVLTTEAPRPTVALLSTIKCSEEAVGFANQFEQLLLLAQTAWQEENHSQAHQLLVQARSIPGYERDSKALQLWGKLLHCNTRAGLRAAWFVRSYSHPMSDRFRRCCLGEDGRFSLRVIPNGIQVWDLTTDQLVREFERTVPPYFVFFGAGDRFVISKSDANDEIHYQIWEVSTGRRRKSFLENSSPRYDKCQGGTILSPDGRWFLWWGRYLCFGSAWNGNHKYKDFPDEEVGRFGTPYRIIDEGEMGIYAACLSVEGRLAVSAGWKKNIRLWDIVTGKCVRILEGHEDTITSVYLSADDRWVLSGGYDYTTRLWDVATGRCIRIFEGHTNSIYSVCLSADGRWAFSGSNGEMRLWDVATGQCVQIFKGMAKDLSDVRLSSDLCWAFAGYKDGTILMWELDWDIQLHEPIDWDEGARHHLVKFLTLHTPYAAALRDDIRSCPLSEEEKTLSLSRKGKPSWTEEEFMGLLSTLENSGYGWLRPDGVKRELEKLAADWDGPPPLFSQEQGDS